ncbi:MAG: hypothetical protein LUE29_09885 [Lachnospiraceae bacterium]|nr:hypothetical protein [Lachnospiraceae bacterium]
MAKMTAYTAATEMDDSDVFLIDGTDGTRKAAASDVAIELAGMISSINHRDIYRGKSLGTEVTSAQQAAIKAGTFDDMFIGDYWTINSVEWIIADMDYWYNTGDTAFATHHLVMVPGLSLSNLYSTQMNSSNTTEGGYVGSLMYTEGLETAKETISEAFGDLVLTHREYLTNAVTNGYPSAGAWYDSTVELMNEIMVYGSLVCAPMGNGSIIPTNYTIDKQQLALFRLSPRAINNRISAWLRDVVSSTDFASVGYDGSCCSHNASGARSVYPVFPIGVAS